MAKDSLGADGGPAFPRQELWLPNDDGGHFCQENGSSGMSLRDYFAAKAIDSAFKFYDEGYWAEMDGPAVGMVAAIAYEIADAMLKAREGK